MSCKTKLLIILLISFSCSVSFAQQWAVTYGNLIFGDNIGEDKAYSIAAGDSGYVYVTGFSYSETNGNDILTIKYDSNGDTVWTARYNGTGNDDDKAFALTVDAANNIYVTGYSTGVNTEQDIITIKYFSNGDTAWVSPFNGSANGDDEGSSLCIDASNSVYVAGFTTGSNGTDFIVIKYNYDGNEVWHKTYDGTGHRDDIAYAIDLDASSHVIATGSVRSGEGPETEDIFTIKYNVETGDTLWTKIYNGNQNLQDKAYAIEVDPLDNIHITGYVTKTPGDRDIATIKYNSQGDLIWVKFYDGSGHNEDIGRSIALTANNDVLVSGWSRSGSNESSADYVIIKYTSSGVQSWVTTYDAGNTDKAYSMVVSETGNAVYVTGSSKSGSGQGTEDMVTLKFDLNTGTALDTSRYNGSGNNEDVALDVAIDSSGNVYVTGYTVLGGGLDHLNASSDYLTLKYSGGNLIGTNSNSKNVPSSFKLHQNYPNPFNPATNIKFELPKREFVKLAVYDLLGREVIVLVNGFFNAGIHSVIFNNSNFASGVYFYELKSENFRDVKKMILIK